MITAWHMIRIRSTLLRPHLVLALLLASLAMPFVPDAGTSQVAHAGETAATPTPVEEIASDEPVEPAGAGNANAPDAPPDDVTPSEPVDTGNTVPPTVGPTMSAEPDEEPTIATEPQEDGPATSGDPPAGEPTPVDQQNGPPASDDGASGDEDIQNDAAEPEAPGDNAEEAPRVETSAAENDLQTAEVAAADTGSVTITLTDQSGTPLPGVHFQRLGLTPFDSPTSVGLTDASGQVVESPMPVDLFAFTYHQVSAPAGCTAASNQTAVLTGDAPHVYLHFVNVCGEVTPETDGTITLTLTDQTGRPLSGVAFQISVELLGTHPVDSGTTDALGVVEFTSLPFGLPYTAHQVAAPAGCASALDQSVALTAATPHGYLRFVNTCDLPPTGSITVQKLDQSGRFLPGVEFELSSSDLPPATGITDAVGGVVFSDLPVDGGPYTLREVAAPEGCTLAENQTILLTSESPDQTTSVVNQCGAPIGNLLLVKTDERGNRLPGAEFQILHDGAVAGSGVTDSSGIIFFRDLPQGVIYTLHEVAAPEGCVVAPDQTVELYEGVSGQSVWIANACAGSTGSIVVTKVDQHGDPRPGAYFIVQRDGGTVAVGTSDAGGNVRFDGLIVEANYTVTELYPPYGCTGSADQTVFLGADTPSQTLEFVNECETPRPSGSITVMKTDQAGTALPGVTFEISATIMTPVAGTTDATGRVTFNALVTDTIHYTVREVAAPEGCTAAADQTVILTETDPEQTVDVVNICDEPDLPSPTPEVTPTDPLSTPASIPSDPATTPVSTPSGSASTSAASASGASVPAAPSSDPAGIGTQETTDPAPDAIVSSTLGVRGLPSAGSGAAGGSLQASLVLMTLSLACVVTGVAVSHIRHR